MQEVKYMQDVFVFKKIENILIYGNPEGTPENRGKCTTEYDDFLKPIMKPLPDDKNKE